MFTISSIYILRNICIIFIFLCRCTRNEHQCDKQTFFCIFLHLKFYTFHDIFSWQTDLFCTWRVTHFLDIFNYTFSLHITWHIHDKRFFSALEHPPRNLYIIVKYLLDHIYKIFSHFGGKLKLTMIVLHIIFIFDIMCFEYLELTLLFNTSSS